MTHAASQSAAFGLWAQYVAIAICVLGAALYVLHDRAPAFSRRLRVALAIPMVREGRPAWLRRLGQRIAPPVVKGGKCDSCNGCGPD